MFAVGGSGMMACETLRQEKFTGRVILATAEKHLPYDRPQLSKAMDKTVNDITLRPQHFYQVIP